MLLRVVQIICIVVTALILFAFREAFYATAGFFGPGFSGGFLAGAVFVIAIYGVACWIDPASRPRGTRPEEHRFRDGLE